MRHVVLLFASLVLLIGSQAVSAQDGEVLNPWNRGPSVSSSHASSAEPIELRAVLGPMPSAFPSWIFQRVLDPWAHAADPDTTIEPRERALTLAARGHARPIARCFNRAFRTYWVDVDFDSRPTIDDAAQSPVHRCLDKVMTHLGLRRPPHGVFTLVLGADHAQIHEIFVIAASKLD